MNQGTMSEGLALVTCSYRPDFERCASLCASVDAFIGPQAHHVIIVPERDRRLFAPLATGHRTVVSTQEVLPARFTHLPLLKKWWLDNGLWPVRGWMMQQVTKLCADAVTDCENILFVDSDIEFVGALQFDRFLRDETLRLHRKPGEKNEGVHRQWHHASAELLGLPPGYFGSDYVGPLITWKRSNLVGLKQHIERSTGRPWLEAVGRRMTVSEYTLYGVYVEHVLGLERAGHFPCADDLCHCLWFGHDTDRFLEEIDRRQAPQAVLVQSNIGLDMDSVNLLMGRVREQLAAS